MSGALQLHSSRNRSGVHGKEHRIPTPGNQQVTTQGSQTINAKLDRTRYQIWLNNENPCYDVAESIGAVDSVLDENVLAFVVLPNVGRGGSSRSTQSSSDDNLPVMTRLNGGFSQADRNRLWKVTQSIRVMGKLRMENRKNDRDPKGVNMLTTVIVSGHTSIINTGYTYIAPGDMVYAMVPHFENGILRNGGIQRISTKPKNVAVLLTMPYNKDILNFEAIRHLTELYDRRENRDMSSNAREQEMAHNATILGQSLAVMHAIGAIDQASAGAGRSSLSDDDVRAIVSTSMSSSNVRRLLSYFSHNDPDGSPAYVFADNKPTVKGYMSVANEDIISQFVSTTSQARSPKVMFNILVSRLICEGIESAANLRSSVNANVVGRASTGASPGNLFDISLFPSGDFART